MESQPPPRIIQSLTVRSTIGEDGSVTHMVELVSPDACSVRRAYWQAAGPQYFRTEQTSAEGLAIEEMSLHDNGDIDVASAYISHGDDVTLLTHIVENGSGRGSVEIRRPAAAAADRVRISYYPE